MSNEHFFEEQTPMIRLRVWALGQMVWGGFMAGLVLAGIGLLLLIVWGVSQMLPQQSKEAPSPYSALEIVQPADQTIA